MPLDDAQKKYLRGLGHQLRPVVIVGDAGLSDGVLRELETALDHHELVKASVRAPDRETRDRLIERLCGKSGAVLVQRIGNMALLYRKNPERQRIRLP